VHCWGKIWRALKERLKVEYDDIARLALNCEREGYLLESEIAEKYFSQPASGVLALLSEHKQPDIVAKSIMRSSCSVVRTAADQLEQLYHRSFDTLVVTGWFSENPAHKTGLGQDFETVVVPPFAGVATPMGMFVEMVCRTEKVPPGEAARILMPSLFKKKRR
jgi:hypothetical protein